MESKFNSQEALRLLNTLQNLLFIEDCNELHIMCDDDEINHINEVIERANKKLENTAYELQY